MKMCRSIWNCSFRNRKELLTLLSEPGLFSDGWAPVGDGDPAPDARAAAAWRFVSSRSFRARSFKSFLLVAESLEESRDLDADFFVSDVCDGVGDCADGGASTGKEGSSGLLKTSKEGTSASRWTILDSSESILSPGLVRLLELVDVEAAGWESSSSSEANGSVINWLGRRFWV